jgi:L-threonylcarbamoyladenylate synthase
MSRTSPLHTRLLPATSENIEDAARALRGGGLVVFPTETVYGLGADAKNAAAVRALFAAKGRPADHPVIVHLADATQLDAWAAEIPLAARQLAEAFWPGPMTLIVRRSARASDLVTGGLDTVGLRVPSHPVARALLQQFGGAIAAPSANRFGRVSATTARHALSELQGRVAIVLDGGPCQVGLESTIIDVSGGQPMILRPGGVTAEQVSAQLKAPIGEAHAAAPRVSGSLPSHYAPLARVELVTAGELVRRAVTLVGEGNRVGVLLSGSVDAAPFHEHDRIVVVPLPADEVQQAHELYAALRRIDELKCDVALAVLPPEGGLRTAVADRLRRAAGPRGEA